MQLALIVPGRLASTRFPQKLLHPILGIPLIVHTARRIQNQVPDLPLFFAVDHPDLSQILREHGFDSILTRSDHSSGTDRLAEANANIGAERVVNVQADEPMVTAGQIRQLCALIQSPGTDLATLAHRFHSPEDFLNPNQVKVVISSEGTALYFSRSPIPYPRDTSGTVTKEWLQTQPCYRHLGLYAYTREFLENFTRLKPSPCESIEKLEQLRALENGFRIAVGITDHPSIGVDTPEDAQLLERLLRDQPSG
ncbi:MAG: 3-deoxy-manno-octulosonate cytidylyltransferase [Puniceicoccaceae bacterium]